MRPQVDPHEQVDALTGAVEDLAGQFTLQPLLRRILRRAVSLLGGGAGSICTVDERAGTYRKEADLGVACQEGKVFSLAEGVTGAVVTHRGPRVFDRYGEVPGGHVAPSERDRLYATVGVPIEWAGAIIGVCVVFSTDPGVRFRDEDVALLGLFAKHAAIAITNARLHEDAEQRARRLAVSAERERVVRDVHDAVARALGSILLHLDLVGSAGAADGAHLDAARDAARTALAETRRTVLGLGPALLEPQPLEEALALELGWVRSTTGIRTDLVVTGERVPLEPDVGQQAMRLAQEALTNVVLHARASVVRAGVLYGADNVTVVIEDDGRGFDPAELTRRRATGFGLTGIVARAQHLGAELQIESTPGWGTRVRAHIPFDGVGVAISGRAPWRVLVVDPKPMVRAGLVRLLAGAEPDVQVVGELGDAQEVVDAVRVLEPDVVLLRLRMPGLDGARLTSYIRAASPAVSILVLTDDLTDDLLRDAVHAGARGCIGSDVDGPGLARAVLAAARGDVLLTERVLHGFAGAGVAPAGESLTEREQEVRGLVERGLQDKQIATHLGISVKTVEKHVGAVLRKTGSANRTALAHRAAMRPATG